MDILQTIALKTKERVNEDKKMVSPKKMEQTALSLDKGLGFPFEESLVSDDISFICEIKKASPSKGVIADDFNYLDIAKEYEEAGAAAISILTEPYWFMGSDQYLKEIADIVSTPLLRKDFTIDSYMIYQAKVLGASAVLFICALLDTGSLTEYINIAHGIGLSALVETHDENELNMALESGARLIGVNNRNLKTFEVDTGVSIRLRKLAPSGIIFVSESGIKTPGDIELLRQNKVDAVLIGETLMRQADKKAALDHLRGRA